MIKHPFVGSITIMLSDAKGTMMSEVSFPWIMIIVIGAQTLVMLQRSAQAW